jgi:hypothetical protein
MKGSKRDREKKQYEFSAPTSVRRLEPSVIAYSSFFQIKIGQTANFQSLNRREVTKIVRFYVRKILSYFVQATNRL